MVQGIRELKNAEASVSERQRDTMMDYAKNTNSHGMKSETCVCGDNLFAVSFDRTENVLSVCVCVSSKKGI